MHFQECLKIPLLFGLSQSISWPGCSSSSDTGSLKVKISRFREKTCPSRQPHADPQCTSFCRCGSSRQDGLQIVLNDLLGKPYRKKSSAIPTVKNTKTTMILNHMHFDILRHFSCLHSSMLFPQFLPSKPIAYL